MIPFSKTLYIERDDFMEVPAKGYFRLSPGAEVRLRYAFIVKCVQVDKMHKVKSKQFIVPTTPTPRAELRVLKAAKSKAISTGYPPNMHSRQKYDCMIVCLPILTRTA